MEVTFQNNGPEVYMFYNHPIMTFHCLLFDLMFLLMKNVCLN